VAAPTIGKGLLQTPPGLPKGEEGLTGSEVCGAFCCMWLNFQLNMFDGTKVQKILENTKRNAQMD
jgi:hypothetical protein